MPGALDLVKAFQLSKMNVYLDGDPMPYIASVKIPPIICPVETFDNTSTGGPIDVADPNRRYADGDGEIKFEQENANLLAKIMDPSMLQSLRIPVAANALNPQLGIFMPLPMEYVITAQFFSVDLGMLQQGTKRDETTKFKMMGLKVKIASGSGYPTVIDFDFINSKFEVNDTDLLAAVTALI